ncbi:MAG: Trk system potassium transporter TrkA [Clostridiales bacterium]|nr:Trk system potassium transporter TrkA [Clostridiales bacterium]
MKIIIAGCGNVGYALAEQLSEEKHDICLIDTRSEELDAATTGLDVIGINGTCSSYRVQEEAGVEDADILIAVTDMDEVNLLACLIAKKTGNCQTIAQVRNPEYYDEVGFLKSELGLSMVINPELAAASEIARLIQVPLAMEIDTFARGRVNLIKFELPENFRWKDKTIREISSDFDGNFLACIIQRGNEIIIPDRRSVLRSGDKISVMVAPRYTNTLFDKLGIPHRVIRNVMIAGGSRISYYLAKSLIRSRIRVKIIEKDHTRCEELSEQLPEAMIIEADASNEVVLNEEGLPGMDAFIALTDRDEENIMLSLYANKVSNAKQITKINKNRLGGIINEIPIGSIVSPKNLTAEYIIRYVRSLKNSLGSNVEAVYRMMDNRVEALEFYIRSDSAVTNVRLMDLKLRDDVLVCTIVRAGNQIIPSGSDMILKGDSVIVVTTHVGLNDIREILA